MNSVQNKASFSLLVVDRQQPTSNNQEQNHRIVMHILYAYHCLSLFIIVEVHFTSVFNFRIRSWLSKNWHAKKCGWKLKVAIFKIKKKTGKLFENWKLSKGEIFGLCICLLFSMHFRRWWTDSDFNGKNLKSRRKTGRLGGWLNLGVVGFALRYTRSTFHGGAFSEVGFQLKVWNNILIWIFLKNRLFFFSLCSHVTFESDLDVMDGINHDKPGRCTSAGIHKLGWP